MRIRRNGAEIYVKYYHRVKLAHAFVQGLFISFVSSQAYHYRHFYPLPFHAHAYTYTMPLRCTKRSPSRDETE